MKKIILFMFFVCFSSLTLSMSLRPANNTTGSASKYSTEYIESAILENTLTIREIHNINDVMPTIKIQFRKEPDSVVGYIFDSYGNSVKRLPDDVQLGSSDPTKYETKIYFASDLVFNGAYYVKVFIKWMNDQGQIYHKEILKFDFNVRIPGRDLGEGFFIYSPNSKLNGLGDTGMYFNLTDKNEPIVAWVDTVNKKVIKYQYYLASPILNPGLKPMVDNISNNSRKIVLKNVKGYQEYGGMIRAVLKNGTFKDTEEIISVHFIKNQIK